MADLRSTYMGIKLKSPIIVGANHLVSNLDNLKRFEDAGASAVVYKTLFEEQISLEKIQFQNEFIFSRQQFWCWRSNPFV